MDEEEYEEHYQEMVRLISIVLERLQFRLQRPREGDQGVINFDLNDLIRVEEHLDSFIQHFWLRPWLKGAGISFQVVDNNATTSYVRSSYR